MRPTPMQTRDPRPLTGYEREQQIIRDLVAARTRPRRQFWRRLRVLLGR